MPEMVYYPTEYGSETMKESLVRVLHSFEDGANKIVIDLKENTVESEENWVELIVSEPVKHTWFAIEMEDILVVEDKDHVFQTKLRFSRDKVVNTRSIYTVLDWLGDIGGLLDAL